MRTTHSLPVPASQPQFLISDSIEKINTFNAVLSRAIGGNIADPVSSFLKGIADELTQALHKLEVCNERL